MDFLGMMGRRVSKFRLKTGLVAQAYHPELWEAESGGLQVQSQPGQLSKILSQNLKITEKELGIQLVLALVCVRDWVQSPVPPPQAYNTHMYTFQTAFWLRFYKYKKLGNYTNSYSFSFFLSFFFFLIICSLSLWDLPWQSPSGNTKTVAKEFGWSEFLESIPVSGRLCLYQKSDDWIFSFYTMPRTY